ncbi:MAG: hypothetical protein IT285_01270 [Bdellovibrionales bacterium]|nr:hypothetical protein [Bdellovibrionales bacterium]
MRLKRLIQALIVSGFISPMAWAATPSPQSPISLHFASERSFEGLNRIELRSAEKEWSLRMAGHAGDLEIRHEAGGAELELIDHLRNISSKVEISKLQAELTRLQDPVEEGMRQAAALVPAQRREMEGNLQKNAETIRSMDQGPVLEASFPRVRFISSIEAKRRQWTREKKPAANEWLGGWNDRILPRASFSSAGELRPLWRLLWRISAGRDAPENLSPLLPPGFSRLLLDAALLLRDDEGIPLEIERYGASGRRANLRFQYMSRKGNHR